MDRECNPKERKPTSFPLTQIGFLKRYQMLTQDYLKEYFSYDPNTGHFIIEKLTSLFSRSVHVGDVAGSKYKDGYINLKINNQRYKAHRLAWLYVHGKFPDNEIDHINGIKDDNRIDNLRDVTKSMNIQNQNKAHKSNKTSGLLGVWFDKDSGRFITKISLNGKQKNLGRFDTKEEAHEVYLTAKREFHSTCTI